MNTTSKVCIIQMEAVHEEIIPSLIHALNSIHIKPDVYINKNCKTRRGDVFERIIGLNACINYVPINGKSDWQNLQELIRDKNYNACIFSTYQRKSILDFSLELEIPVFGIVHNVSLFIEAFLTSRSAKAKQSLIRGIITLSEHVSTTLINEFKYASATELEISCLKPYFWQDISTLSSDIPSLDSTTFVIPGGVNFANRDFKGLISAFSEISTSISQVHFIVAGGGRDRDSLEATVKDLSLDQYFSFATRNTLGWVEYKDYYECISSSAYVLPLTSNKAYLSTKITSAIPTSIGFCKPSLIPEEQKDLYGIPAFPFAGDDLGEGIMNIVNCGNAQYLEIKNDLSKLLSEQLKSNAESTQKLLSRAI
jgi:glycosyltransferase involved in cell wall biosynthesis